MVSLSPHSINEAVAKTFVGRWFRLEGSGHPLARPGSKFLTELRAGTVTAAAMLYIISVNASILSDSGGPCVCEGTADDPICATNTDYALCKNELRRDYVTATSSISLIATFLMGLLANMPLGLAPGLGVNAYFAYSQVGFNGTGPISYHEALAAVFLEGIIFFALTILGLRQWVVRLIPRSITTAIGSGIGLFLTIIGLSSSGLNVISGGVSTPLQLGGCISDYADATTGFCNSHVLQDPRMWLGIFVGGVLTAFLLLYRVKGALLWPILLVAIISWPRPTSVTAFPHTELGDSNFDFFKNVVAARGFKLLGPSNVDWKAYANGKVWVALISFLYVDLLDTTGTMVAMSKQAGLYDARDGDFEGSSVAFLVDSACIAASGLFFGTSPCTPFVESASGISEGGKTGLTAITTAFWFFISIFFAPILSNIPAWATGSVLIVVGAMMMENAVKINWDYMGDAIPAFVVIAVIPFTYNVAYGIIAGLILFILLHNVPKLLGMISPQLLPPGWKDLKEPYNSTAFLKQPNGKGRVSFLALLPPWLRKLVSGEKRFWAYTPEEIERILDGRKISQETDDAAARMRQDERDEMRKRMGEEVVTADEAKSDEHSDDVNALEQGIMASGSAYEMERK
ncbi:uncharacterized protein I303_106336 [Kwoniella dejecticola CBS 10117]|uniref:Xanthine/uracil permease n=1 Tax=Kwoniella dejecticola CBS 10117 TaxID=1296121 RepID=A0A1A5ZV07_9TREE|nr:uncharacterized protein I303_08407 [Kwoniella dejecticola CBS 10117]OBR81636.1 hypothetical protein I303_08407 [Kwoniella dejecticola CBS 10117]